MIFLRNIFLFKTRALSLSFPLETAERYGVLILVLERRGVVPAELGRSRSKFTYAGTTSYRSKFGGGYTALLERSLVYAVSLHEAHKLISRSP